MNRYYTQPISQIEPQDFQYILSKALEEDCPDSDVTTESIFSSSDRGEAILKSREEGIVCGLPLLNLLRDMFTDQFNFTLSAKEGEKVHKGTEIARLNGQLIRLLKLERIILNFLQYLSGIATTANSLSMKYPDLLILDTRKTLPGYRKLVKYAVYTGGGANHRINLSDMALIKDNHIALCGSITNAVSQIRSKYPDRKIELEIDSPEQLDEALESRPDIIMLDNFSDEDTIFSVNIILFYE